VTRQTLWEQSAKAARRFNIPVTESRDRFARQLRPCARCREWKSLTEFDTGKNGNRYPSCRECRKAKKTTQVRAAHAAAHWTPPPGALDAARNFISLMGVPAEWRVPK